MHSSQPNKVSQHSIVQLLHWPQTNYNQTSLPFMPQIIFYFKTSQLMSLVKEVKRQNTVVSHFIMSQHDFFSKPACVLETWVWNKCKYWFQTFCFISNLPFLLLLVGSLAHLIDQLFASDFPFFPVLVHLRKKTYFIWDTRKLDLFSIVGNNVYYVYLIIWEKSKPDLFSIVGDNAIRYSVVWRVGVRIVAHLGKHWGDFVHLVNDILI